MATTQVHNKRRQKIVADACREKLPSLTIAKRLHAQHPKLFASVEVARSAVRRLRGNNGNAHRKDAANKIAFRPSGSQSDRPPLPKSLAKPWEPYILDARRVLVLSDCHFPFQDETAIEAALAHGDDFDPDAILLNGDTLDFEALSKFDKPSGGPTVKEELVAGRAFLAHLQHRFPNARKYLKKGNHEDRWDTYFWRKAIELDELCQDVWQHFLGTDDYGVTVIGDQRPIMLGKLMVLHGHEKGRGMQSSVNPARGAFLRLLCSVLEGHGHRTSEHTERTADGRVIACRSTGCLCDLHPAYARLNKWDQSFATVETSDGGGYECRLHRIVNGKVR